MAPVRFPRIVMTVGGCSAGFVAARGARVALAPTCHYQLRLSTCAGHINLLRAGVASAGVAVACALWAVVHRQNLVVVTLYVYRPLNHVQQTTDETYYS